MCIQRIPYISSKKVLPLPEQNCLLQALVQYRSGEGILLVTILVHAHVKTIF
jgi:hypothetical protein